MVSRFDDALLRDILASEQEYSRKLRDRRAESINLREPADVLAFYDRQIAETDHRIRTLMKRPLDEESR